MYEREWVDVADRARAFLNFGVAKKEWLEGSRLARFIASIPFLAGCDKPRETSFIHLLTYLASLEESAKDIFMPGPADDADLYSRLTPLMLSSGGDGRVLSCCRDLLALCMVANYRDDAASDLSLGKHNPVALGKWDAEALIDSLKSRIRASATPDILALYTEDDALKGIWKD